MNLKRRTFLAGSGAALVSAAAHSNASAELLHRCGVVEMRTHQNGGVGIYGWQDLKPNDVPVISPRRRPMFVITASFEDKILEVHQLDTSGEYFPRGIWPVVTPYPEELPGTIDGTVYRIETEPNWHPSANLRRKYENYRQEHPEENLPPLPAGMVPYGHDGNPMGERKVRANWRGRYPASAVLHGTTGYPIELCGAETAGCVRLHNDWIVALVDNILGGVDHALSAGVECIFTPEPIARRV